MSRRKFVWYARSGSGRHAVYGSEVSEAKEVCFQFEELTRLQFFPHVLGDRATRVRLEGTVVSVKARYAFVSAPGTLSHRHGSTPTSSVMEQNSVNFD